jgi:hypothetical protein
MLVVQDLLFKQVLMYDASANIRRTYESRITGATRVVTWV